MSKTVSVTSSSEVREGQLCTVKVEGKSVIVTRVRGQLRAFSAKCPHVGLSLAKGHVEDGTIRCPWHGSRFDMLTGANLDWTNSFAGRPMPQWTHRLLSMGKKPAPLQMFEATEKDGMVYVTLPDA